MGNGERCIDALHICTRTQASFHSLGQAKQALSLSLSLSLSLASCSPVPIVRSNCTVMGREREREICLVPGLIKVIDTAKGGRWTLDNDLALDNHNLSLNKMKVREIVTKCC
jgi:hypothetical protein